MRKVFSAIAVAILMAALAISPIALPKVHAAGLNNAYATGYIADRMTGATGSQHLVYFEVPSGIAPGANISFTYPAGFDVSAGSLSYVGHTAGATAHNGQILSAVINEAVSAGSGLTVYLNNITNGGSGAQTITIATPQDSGSATLNIIGSLTRFDILPSSAIATTAGANFTFTVMAMSGGDNAYTATPVSLSASDSGLSVNSVSLDRNTGAKQITASMTKAGSYTITASGDGVSGSSNTITVSHATANSISISPSSATLNINGTKQFSATASDAYGNSWNATSAATWSTSNGSISHGLYTAQNAGTFSVSASLDGKSGSAQVTVNQAQSGGGEEETQTPSQSESTTYQQSASEQVTSASVGAVKNTSQPTAKATETSKSQTAVSTPVTTEQTTSSNRTMEKVVLAVVALALLGTSAYFLFKKSPEDALGNGSGDSGVKITPAEEIIKKAEQAAKSSTEQKIKEEHEKNLSK